MERDQTLGRLAAAVGWIPRHLTEPLLHLARAILISNDCVSAPGSSKPMSSERESSRRHIDRNSTTSTHPAIPPGEANTCSSSVSASS